MHFYFAYPVIFELTWPECVSTVAIQTLSLMDRRAVYLAIMLDVFGLSLPLIDDVVKFREQKMPHLITKKKVPHVLVNSA